MKKCLLIVSLLAVGSLAHAKLPAPPAPTPEAAAAAAEARAKAAHGAKVEGYKLCMSMERAAASHFKMASAAGKNAQPSPNAPACVNPGPYVPGAGAPAKT